MAKKHDKQPQQQTAKPEKPVSMQPDSSPWQDEKPTIVHLEKNESHYEFCRMQMHDLEKIYRRAFIANAALCVIVCFLAIFSVYIQCFSIFSTPFIVMDSPGATISGGILQITVAMFIVVMGYLAWANYRLINIALTIFYGAVTILGIYHLDYFSGIIGVIGLWFYIFALQGMQKESRLAEMEGYPDFHEKFDISTSDIVIQTLMAHRGERSHRSGGVFQNSRSLRKRKKRSDSTFQTEEQPSSAEALAQQLASHKQNQQPPAQSTDS